MNPVTPQLHVGSREDANNAALLADQGIEAVLSFEPVSVPKTVQCQMMLEVKDRVPLPATVIDSAVEFIHLQISKGRRILVHCQMGISRSPALAAAYLHRYQKMPLDQAIERIRRARPEAAPHPTLVTSLQRHYAPAVDGSSGERCQ